LALMRREVPWMEVYHVTRAQALAYLDRARRDGVVLSAVDLDHGLPVGLVVAEAIDHPLVPGVRAAVERIFYIRHAYRRRTGVCRALTRALMTWAREQGCSAVGLARLVPGRGRRLGHELVTWVNLCSTSSTSPHS
jgi:GNAT superfamily N-acetyltransferase